MNINKVLIDTNCLLDGFNINEGSKYIILSHIGRELDKHKVHGDNELKYKTRQAVRFIEENFERFEFDIKDYNVTFDECFDNNYTDNKIIQACLDNKYSLMTSDLLLKQKAKAYKIGIVKADDNHSNKNYTGFIDIKLSEQELSDFYSDMDKNHYNLLINQYVIIRDLSNKIIDKYRWNGQTHKKIIYASKDIKVSAQNVQQELALDLLLDTSIPIKFVTGNYGSGKTLLSVKSAIHHVLHKGNQSKILMIRNPIGSGKEVGFLKGTKEDKTEGFFKPLIQHLDGGEQDAERLERNGVLLKEIPYYLKGMSFEDTILLCDEAEDLDVKLIKLIGTRLGRNSTVIFSGDYNQVENEYKNNNGLITAIEELKGNPLVGIVVLEEDIRSEASKVFANL